MFELVRQPNSLRLLQWTKELPSASVGDLLGLSLRVSARLANELLYCITSITPRADREALRNVFFSRYEETDTPAQQRRRMSLLLILESVGHARTAGLSLNNTNLGNICYFGATQAQSTRKQHSSIVAFNPRLSDIAHRQEHGLVGAILATDRTKPILLDLPTTPLKPTR